MGKNFSRIEEPEENVLFVALADGPRYALRYSGGEILFGGSAAVRQLSGSGNFIDEERHPVLYGILCCCCGLLHVALHVPDVYFFA